MSITYQNNQDIRNNYLEKIASLEAQEQRLEQEIARVRGGGKVEDFNEPHQNNDAEVRRLQSELDRVRQELRESGNLRCVARQKVVDALAEIASLKKIVEDLKADESDGILEVHYKQANGKVLKTKGTFHKCFRQVLELCQARMNVFIFGPAGCGKSYLCEQVATTMNLRFAFVSCTAGMSEGVLGGRLLPVGKNGTFEYAISEFVKCYEEGGVFLLDEIDAADPNVLLFINAALANGKMAVPNRTAKPYAARHVDFICVAAANTCGNGADRLHSGRNKLDNATLSRFQIGKVFMDYDTRVDEALCPDEPLRNRLLKYRKAVREHQLERDVSSRFLEQAHTMKNLHKWSDEQIDNALFTGWREDETNKVKQAARY